jgi:hypothetical protein
MRFALAMLLACALAGCAGKHGVRGEDAPENKATVSCKAGPVEASFGALPWLAYACDDGRSVALAAAPGNPAAPFTFVVRPSPTGVRVQGDGAGDRALTAAAFAELMALDDDAVVRLFERALLESEVLDPNRDGG